MYSSPVTSRGVADLDQNDQCCLHSHEIFNYPSLLISCVPRVISRNKSFTCTILCCNTLPVSKSWPARFTRPQQFWQKKPFPKCLVEVKRSCDSEERSSET